MAGVLFGIHPLHVESVAWVSERKDVLCAFFFFLSVFSYIKYAGLVSESFGSPGLSGLKDKRYLFSLFFFILALLSKPMAVTLPLLLLILDWYPVERFRRLQDGAGLLYEKLPFLVFSVFSSIVTLAAQDAGGAVRDLIDVPLFSRVLLSIKAVVTYVVKIFVPVQLSPFYPYPKDISISNPLFLLSILTVVFLSCLCVIRHKKNRAWCAVWLAYLTLLLPVMGIVKVGDQAMADRYVYLPTTGFFILIGAGLVRAKIRFSERFGPVAAGAVFYSGLVVIIVALSYRTFEYTKIWRDGKTLWNYVVEIEPAATVAYANLGHFFLSEGAVDNAMVYYQKALALSPSNADALSNLAICFVEKGQNDKAMQYAMSAIALHPRKGSAYNTIGEIHLKNYEYEKALGYFMKGLALEPQKPLRYFNIAVTLENMGRLKEACNYWAKYLGIGKGEADFLETSQHFENLGCLLQDTAAAHSRSLPGKQ
ncbi:MAG: tetratricopeptide repeat protein [Nitrospirae bacterium]|nr:MAG: tetratricopeptide repeat protein [Nitrospirota bacterium]